MMEKKEDIYAIVKSDEVIDINTNKVIMHSGHFSFSKWHNYKEAVQEAERLARKEGIPFILLKYVGEVHTQKIPVKWVNL